MKKRVNVRKDQLDFDFMKQEKSRKELARLDVNRVNFTSREILGKILTEKKGNVDERD